MNNDSQDRADEIDREPVESDPAACIGSDNQGETALDPQAVDPSSGDGGRVWQAESAAPDPLIEGYQALLRKVQGLPELPMQASLVRRQLQKLEAEEQVWMLDQLLRSALWGHKGGMETMLAAVWWLLEMRRSDEYGTIKTLFETAHHTDRKAVLDLFREVPPHQSLADGQELPEVRLPMDGDITLGERRTMAAGRRRKLLERLLLDSDPLVIAKLLDNPQIRLDDVRVVATRRPTTPDLLRVCVEHPRWFSRYGVREAVVRNPYADTGLVLKLLPTMRIKTMRRIRFSGDLHELVHDAAKRLVKLREERTAPWGV